MSGKFSKIMAFVFLFFCIGIVLVLCAAAYEFYASSRKALDTAFSQMPAFDVENERKSIAEHEHWEYPLSEPVSRKEYQQKLKDALELEAEKAYPTKQYSADFIALSKKHTVAREGSKVEFKTTPMGDWIKGTYRGREGDLILILQDNGVTRKVTMSSIDPEFQSLFDATEAKQLEDAMLDELKEHFKETRAKAKSAKRVQVIKSLEVLGYTLQHDAIITKEEYLQKKTEQRYADYLKEVAELVNQHKFLGFYEFPLLEEVRARHSSTMEKKTLPPAKDATSSSTAEKQ